MRLNPIPEATEGLQEHMIPWVWARKEGRKEDYFQGYFMLWLGIKFLEPKCEFKFLVPSSLGKFYAKKYHEQ